MKCCFFFPAFKDVGTGAILEMRMIKQETKVYPLPVTSRYLKPLINVAAHHSPSSSSCMPSNEGASSSLARAFLAPHHLSFFQSPCNKTHHTTVWRTTNYSCDKLLEATLRLLLKPCDSPLEAIHLGYSYVMLHEKFSSSMLKPPLQLLLAFMMIHDVSASIQSSS